MSSSWSRPVKDVWFLGTFVLAILAVSWLFYPFFYVLATASAIVVVSWPMYQRILRFCGERRLIAALLMTALVTVLVLGPLGLLLYLFTIEAVTVIQAGDDFVKNGGEEQVVQALKAYEDSAGFVWLQANTPIDSVQSIVWTQFSGIDAVIGPIQSGALTILNGIGSLVPNLMSSVFVLSLNVMMLLFATVTFYMEGPFLVQRFKLISPMDDAYEDRLLAVFVEFANAMVVASLATAVLQGVVASIGYGIAGSGRVVFLGILTAVFSFIPVVGTAAVWIPVSATVWFHSGWGWALFVVLWSVAFTGTVDNVVKPLFLRGSVQIHPLLIFLSVFGGMTWLGVLGALVGPLLVSLLLALQTIYLDDFVGEERPASDDKTWDTTLNEGEE